MAWNQDVQFEGYVLEGENRVENLVCTSTFGNITRLKILYLKDGEVFSGELYPDDYGNDFAPLEFWGPHHLPRDVNGDLHFAAAPNEARPWEVPPYPHPTKLVQYFRKRNGEWGDDLRALANGRSRYWKSPQRIHGGVAYENMALVEDFRQGHRFFFGIYRGKFEELLRGVPSR